MPKREIHYIPIDVEHDFDGIDLSLTIERLKKVRSTDAMAPL
ncbi:MAG: hypothetical protein NPIRA02_29700 [Nitrospirales bacterium]|nr:MAG: hypothetical protein NPIRA02_29700 [Nitrospirales bacterium]